MPIKPLKIDIQKKHLVVNYNGSPFIKVIREVLSDFLSDLAFNTDFKVSVEKKKKKKKKKKEKMVNKKKITKAIQLTKHYANMRNRHYKIKNARVVSPNSVDFKHFLKAVNIITINKTKIKIFMKAQISGLSFVDSGIGVFPKINQLSTVNAEQRLLDYLKRQKLSSVELTDYERQIDLQENKKYKKYYRLLKSGDASLLEALYIQECQLARTDNVQDMVTDYIKMLKKV